jgi:hypothetical protein
MTSFALRWRFIAFCLLCVLVQWPERASAIGAVGPSSPTEAVVSYQHPGETAQGWFGGRKYRICVDFPDGTQGCTTTDNQSKTLSGLTVGSTYRVRVYCHCKGSDLFAIAITKTILDLSWHHAAPGQAVPPQIVRLRSATSPLCLYPQNNRLLYSEPCGPLTIMRFAIEDVPNGRQIRHLGSNLCIHAGFPQPNPVVVMAPCGKLGTRIWIRTYQNGLVRLDISTTQDQVFGYPPVTGDGGCVRASSTEGGQATKHYCHWEPWLLEDMFYLDPA